MSISRTPASSVERVPGDKFGLLVDLGTVVVPKDYVHDTRLDCFAKRYRKSFWSYHSHITYRNFPNPSQILKPGDQLWVRAFKQMVSGSTTSEERMAFLVMQNAVYTGAQGSSLVWEQKRDDLPKGYWYCSFDKQERLYRDVSGDHRVPILGALDDDFYFRLGVFGHGWLDDDAFLCFCNKDSV